MIEIINLSKIFSDKKLFENVNLRFTEGNTYGIIGANGAGKSTFLNILANREEASSGNIVINKNKRISVLEQNQSKYQDEIVINVVIRGNDDLFKIQAQKDAIYLNPNATNEDYEKAATLEEEYGAKGGWSAENDAQILLSGLGVEKSWWNLPMRELKSSDKVKVLLAKALFGDPDILIMDEPTNYLDLKAIRWLEKFLVDYQKLVIIVSHDSDFLDEVCTHIVDIDFGKAQMFSGNYSFWKESSALALDLTQRQNEKKEEQMKKLQEFIARFSANAKRSSQATSRKKALDKINLEEIKPSNRRYPFIRFDLNRQTGKDILSVNNLSYINNQGEKLFENVSFTLKANEKMVIVGQDDVAKTKLLEILMNLTKPTTGEVKWGITVSPSYFPRDNAKYFSKNQTILEWISQWPLENKINANKDNADSRMRSFLGRMLFSGDAVFKDVTKTSGGEKSRLMFSRMMLQESNFLVLDDPLNHLDTESIDAVIEGVKTYQSNVIFTTYNQAMIRECANVIFELKTKDSSLFRGTLLEYEQRSKN